MVVLSSATVIMGTNATIQENKPIDISVNSAKAYCDPTGPVAPFLDCINNTCTYTYQSLSPYLNCYYNPVFVGNCSNTMYAANFTNAPVYYVTTNNSLNFLLAKASLTGAPPMVISLGGLYPYFQLDKVAYTPTGNLCIQVCTNQRTPIINRQLKGIHLPSLSLYHGWGCRRMK